MNALPIQRVLPHLPAVAAWLLALALGVQAALIVRDLIPQPKSTPPTATLESGAPSRDGNQSKGNRSMSLQGILNAHLFGEPGAEAASASGEAIDAPQTQLSLVLAGTIAVDDPQKGMALVGENAASAKVYSVGKTIAGAGVRLNAVYSDRVILDRDGQLEALYLPRRMAASGPAPRRAALNAPTQGAALANRVQQMISQDPGSIAEIMRPQPVFVNGQQRGFRVYPGRNREQFERLGLMAGDLIMAINGTPLDDPARGMEIFRSMSSASEVSVTIERGGNKQDLVLDMAQLASEAEAISPEQGDENIPPPPDPPTDEEESAAADTGTE